MAEDYCELCDLPLSQCVHGQPKPVPEEKKAPTPRVRTTSVRTTSARAAGGGAPTARVPGTPARTAPRRWTSPEELKAPIVALLTESGGEVAADDVFAALEARIGEGLRSGDREPSPQGEPRWQLAARKARRALQDEGLVEAGTPGVWRLSPRAR